MFKKISLAMLLLSIPMTTVSAQLADETDEKMLNYAVEYFDNIRYKDNNSDELSEIKFLFDKKTSHVMMIYEPMRKVEPADMIYTKYKYIQSEAELILEKIDSSNLDDFENYLLELKFMLADIYGATGKEKQYAYKLLTE